jgi:hypothetical protein
MGLRILKEMDTIVHFFAAIQKPYSLFLVCRQRPICALLYVAMASSEEKVGILVT